MPRIAGVDIPDNKKIYYSLKDVLRKDDSSGNTNHYSQMLFWCLPFLGIYKWLTLKYDKEIARAMKRYKKWQEVSIKRRTHRSPLCPITALTFAVALCASGAQPSEAGGG